MKLYFLVILSISSKFSYLLFTFFILFIILIVHCNYNYVPFYVNILCFFLIYFVSLYISLFLDIFNMYIPYILCHINLCCYLYYFFAYIFLWVYSVDIFPNLWWTQSSLILRFYSNISTYCHIFPLQYCLTLLRKCLCIWFVLQWPWR